MAVDIETYALAKKYTHDATEGLTMIEGKPCTISSIANIAGGHRVTFRWTANDGTTKTQTMDIMDGAQGPQGVKGDTGNTGAQGIQGVAGQAATISIGSVTSGASPSVNNSGTAQNAVLDFVLAKGDKGDKGDKGEDGQNGSSFSIRSRFATYADLVVAYPTGPENEGDAYFVGTGSSPDLYIWIVEDSEWHNNGPIAGVKGDKGDTGNEGYSPVASVSKQNGVATITIRDKTGQTTATVEDGEDGQAGADGKSAYQLAVDGGYVGTQAEWLASLKGETGAAGSNGTNGSDGVSPVANVTKTGDVYKIHIEDASGTTEETFDLSSKANTTDLTALTTRVSTAEDDIDDIQAVIPSGASSSNPLIAESNGVIRLTVDRDYFGLSTVGATLTPRKMWETLIENGYVNKYVILQVPYSYNISFKMGDCDLAGGYLQGLVRNNAAWQEFQMLGVADNSQLILARAANSSSIGTDDGTVKVYSALNEEFIIETYTESSWTLPPLEYRETNTNISETKSGYTLFNMYTEHAGADAILTSLHFLGGKVRMTGYNVANVSQTVNITAKVIWRKN